MILPIDHVIIIKIDMKGIMIEIEAENTEDAMIPLKALQAKGELTAKGIIGQNVVETETVQIQLYVL